jgi:hypothetical protein
MADHAAPTGPYHHDMDGAEHERTYRGFLLLVKWGIIFNVVLLILMAIFLL